MVSGLVAWLALGIGPRRVARICRFQRHGPPATPRNRVPFVGFSC